jgi:hypothetical protein
MFFEILLDTLKEKEGILQAHPWFFPIRESFILARLVPLSELSIKKKNLA